MGRTKEEVNLTKPYNAGASCGKCRHNDVTTLYCKEFSCWALELGEHFHRTCQRCSYEWLEDCVSALEPVQPKQQEMDLQDEISKQGKHEFRPPYQYQGGWPFGQWPPHPHHWVGDPNYDPYRHWRNRVLC